MCKPKFSDFRHPYSFLHLLDIFESILIVFDSFFTDSFFRCTNDSSVAKIKIHQISDEDHITELGIFCRKPENVNEQSFPPKVVPKSSNEEDIAANFEQKLRFDLHKWDGSSLEFRYKQERRQLTEI
jgi:hypothetical protein